MPGLLKTELNPPTPNKPDIPLFLSVPPAGIRQGGIYIFLLFPPDAWLAENS